MRARGVVKIGDALITDELYGAVEKQVLGLLEAKRELKRALLDEGLTEDEAGYVTNAAAFGVGQ